MLNPQEGTYRIRAEQEHLYSRSHSTYNFAVCDLKDGYAFISPMTTIKTGRESSLAVWARLSTWAKMEHLEKMD